MGSLVPQANDKGRRHELRDVRCRRRRSRGRDESPGFHVLRATPVPLDSEPVECQAWDARGSAEPPPRALLDALWQGNMLAGSAATIYVDESMSTSPGKEPYP